MKYLVAFSFCLFSMVSFATTPLRASLEKLASNADHILAGHVIGVDMVDKRGVLITDGNARTGPGLGNTIRLIIKVDEVFITRSRFVPGVLKVPLDPMMHFRLGQIKAAHSRPSKTLLLLLKGRDFQPIVPGVFARKLEDKNKALAIHAASRRSNKAMKPAW